MSSYALVIPTQKQYKPLNISDFEAMCTNCAKSRFVHTKWK